MKQRRAAVFRVSPQALMRLVLGLLLFAAVLVGCQGNQNLQGRIDSLRTANENLKRQVQALRDSLQLERGGGTTLTPAIFFPSGSAWLFNDAKQKLDEHAQTLKEKYPNADFRVQGYTDPVPIGPGLKDTYPSNWYLSAQRAAAVAHYLDREHGIRTESLEIEAFGPPSVASPDETPAPRPKERRVEIVVEERN